jgi:hypothetical protein
MLFMKIIMGAVDHLTDLEAINAGKPPFIEFVGSRNPHFVL